MTINPLLENLIKNTIDIKDMEIVNQKESTATIKGNAAYVVTEDCVQATTTTIYIYSEL